MTTKTCTQCKIPKELQDYHKSKMGKYGVKSECKECIKLKGQIYYKENAVKIIERQHNNKDYITNYQKQYYIDNKQNKISYQVDYIRQRRLEDPLFKLSDNIRCLIIKSFKNQYTKKAKKTINILGCTFAEFKSHLECKFTNIMNWENYGIYWEMDHIVPVSWATTEEELYKLNHYTNFQPLTKADNMAKGNRYII